MPAYIVDFPERTIAQAITVMRAYCRATNKIPQIVALVEGTSAERDAWRKVANDYLTARAKGRKVDLAGRPIDQGEKNGSPDYDFAGEFGDDRG